MARKTSCRRLAVEGGRAGEQGRTLVRPEFGETGSLGARLVGALQLRAQQPEVVHILAARRSEPGDD